MAPILFSGAHPVRAEKGALFFGCLVKNSMAVKQYGHLDAVANFQSTSLENLNNFIFLASTILVGL